MPAQPPAGYEPDQGALRDLAAAVQLLGQPGAELQHCVASAADNSSAPWMLWHGLPAHSQVRLVL